MQACGFSLISLSPCCAMAYLQHTHDGMVFLYSFMDFTSRFSLFPSVILYMLRKSGGVFFCGLFFGWWKWHLGGPERGMSCRLDKVENRWHEQKRRLRLDSCSRASGRLYGRTIGWKRRPWDGVLWQCGPAARKKYSDCSGQVMTGCRIGSGDI